MFIPNLNSIISILYIIFVKCVNVNDWMMINHSTLTIM